VALIRKHPQVEDYFVELSLPEIQKRGGVADFFEEGRLILIKDYRLDFDTEALSSLSKSVESIEDRNLRKRLKKLTADHFIGGAAPSRSGDRLLFSDPVRQAVFDILCRGDRTIFRRAQDALRHADSETKRLFAICFPSYKPFRLVPSVRLTRTLFENLHWDNHSINDDFHQVRLFANLDSRPRIWNVSHLFTRWVREFYVEHDLGRFAGTDPNLMIDYITGNVLGGTTQTWMDSQPRHLVAFEPGEVWLAESRLLSHQIVYGDAAIVYMWFVEPQSMIDPQARFNARVEDVHRSVREEALTARVGG
jgi:hypothetical protein